MVESIKLPNSDYGRLVPEEDSLLISGNVFCVADGITRDPTSPSDFTGASKEEITKYYPNPSGARKAADLFCKTFIESIEEEKDIKKAFIKGNNAIKELNTREIKEVDYLVNDYYGCVATAGYIDGKRLFWGNITDTRIAIINKGKITFQSPNCMEAFDQYSRQFPGDWNKPDRRKEVRSQFRNNRDKIYNGKCVSYGALTGEKTAENFMNFGEIELKSDDIIIFYTDGFEDTIKYPDFLELLNKPVEEIVSPLTKLSERLAKENYARYGKERSMILVRPT